METPHGQFELTNQSIAWIDHHCKPSMYNNERCFIYNKAFYEAFYSDLL